VKSFKCYRSRLTVLTCVSVPAVLVFTKFDEVVSKVLSELASSGAQHHGHALARAHILFENSCRRLFHKDPKDVPAEIVSGMHTQAFSPILLEGSNDVLIVSRESKIY
jgi:hypothetical protein